MRADRMWPRLWSAALLAGAIGCADVDILEEEAARQVAAELSQELCAAARFDKDRPIAVLPLRGATPEAGQRMAALLGDRLVGCGADVVHLPDDADTETVNRAVAAIMDNEALYAPGQMPEFEWIGAEQVLVGKFTWLRQQATLVHLGIQGRLIDVKERRRLWSGAASSAEIEYKNFGLRMGLFIFLAIVINVVRANMWKAAQRSYVALWAGAVLVWMVLFYILLQDYVFYLWKSA